MKLGTDLLFTSILLLGILPWSEGLIVRLNCKQYGNFSVTNADYVLQGSVVNTLLFLSQEECKLECLFNTRCKSINSENGGNGTCELNSKTPEDIRDNVTLSVKRGWTFATTNYSEPLVGNNCKQNSPCKRGVLCKDTCECPGYKCYPCDKGQVGIHCQDCHNILLTAPRGTVTSPGYPESYSVNETCTYMISVASEAVIKLTFVDFTLETLSEDDGCIFDYLEISEEGGNTTRFCGHYQHFTWLSESNFITLSFVSDYSLVYKGFRILYESIAAGRKST